jgi:hypothetical protein
MPADSCQAREAAAEQQSGPRLGDEGGADRQVVDLDDGARIESPARRNQVVGCSAVEEEAN